jgi:hypothetical protein
MSAHDTHDITARFPTASHGTENTYSLTGPARRADRTLIALMAVAAVVLTVGLAAVFALGSRSEPAGATEQLAPAPPPTAPESPTVSPVADDQVAELTQEPALQPEAQPPAPAVEPQPEPQPEPTLDPDPEPEPDPEPTPEPEPGNPDPDLPHVNPCIEAAEDGGRQFATVDDIVLATGQLGGISHITSCSPAPLPLLISSVPEVSLGFESIDLDPAGADLVFTVDDEAWSSGVFEFVITVDEDCCSHDIRVRAIKPFDLGSVVVDGPIVFDAPEAVEVEEAIVDFIDLYGFHPGEYVSPTDS